MKQTRNQLASINNKHLELTFNLGHNTQTPLYHNQVLATGTNQQKSYDHVQAKKHDKTIKPNEKDERKVW